METHLTRIIWIAGVTTLLLSGCVPAPPKEIDWRTFDGQRAFDQVRAVVNLGPRPAGSPALARQATYVTSQLAEYGIDAAEQVFIAPSPRGPMQFRNVVGRTPRSRGGPGQVIIVACHYDTKWYTNMTFVGANDGGSGVGALLELARCSAMVPNLWFVFFDGEEAMVDYTDTDGLVGSKYFVQELKAKGQLDWIRALILLDMVGDRNLQITIPRNVTPALAERVFEAARDVGHRDHFRYADISIHDDHVPFLQAGVPAVNLIDFEFGSAPGLNDYWHTDKDTLDKVSPTSLEIVGRTVLRLIQKLREGEPVR